MKVEIKKARWTIIALRGFILFFLLSLNAISTIEVLGMSSTVQREWGDHPKVILIGLDGATWNVCLPLMVDGKLPNMKKLMDKGVWGPLETIQGSSPVIWTTIATGRRPDEHGILSFTTPLQEGEHEMSPYRNYHRKCKALWNILSDSGMKVGVINYMITWPAESVNGFMVSPFGSRFGGVYPADLEGDISTIINNVDKESRLSAVNPKDSFEEALKDHILKVNRISTVTLFLYNRFKKDIDLFITYTQEPDGSQHKFWKFMEPEKFQDEAWKLRPEDISKYAQVIPNAYERLDEMIGELMGLMDSNTVIMVVSDHGGYPHKWPRIKLDMNRLLERIGVLSFKEGTEEVDLNNTKIFSFFRDNWYEVYSNIKGNEGRELLESLSNILSNLRTKRTKEKVFKNEGKDLLESLSDILSNFRTKATEQRVFWAVDWGITLYSEPYIKCYMARDINLDNEIEIGGRVYRLSDFAYYGNDSGKHLPIGIFIVAGPHIKKNMRIEGASVKDITPTLLYLLGLPVGKDMYGKVLVDIIEPEFVKSNPIEYIDTYGVTDELTKKKSVPVDSRYDQELLERLKSLGYIQ